MLWELFSSGNSASGNCKHCPLPGQILQTEIGAADGRSDGARVGGKVGSNVVGIEVGSKVGVLDGWSVGEFVGAKVGAAVGESVGHNVGKEVGVFVGELVGRAVGASVGVIVGIGQRPHPPHALLDALLCSSLQSSSFAPIVDTCSSTIPQRILLELRSSGNTASGNCRHCPLPGQI
jgi:hypothetical protein